MSKKIIITFALLFFTAAPAYAGNYLCGALVKDPGCRKQLTKLRNGCRKKMAILGHSYEKGRLPNVERLQERYKSLWKSNRLRFLGSVCGVRLYSNPATYCGEKAIEVAAGCIKYYRKVQARKTAAPQKVRTSRSQKMQRMTQKAAPYAAPLAQEEPEEKSASKHEEQVRPITGSIKTKLNSGSKSGSSGGSTSGWFYFLQFLIILLLLYGFFLKNREGSPSQGESKWSFQSRWESSQKSDWQQIAVGENSLESDQNEIVQALQDGFHHLENKIVEKSRVSNSKAYGELQSKADGLFDYYYGLAHKIVGMVADEQTTSIQQNLLVAREQLNWIFQSHREPLHSASVVEELRVDLLQGLDGMLERLGYINTKEMIMQQMEIGKFDIQGYLESTEEEQAISCLKGHQPSSFQEIRVSFLQRLEQLYRSNLEAIRNLAADSSSISIEEQQRLYQQNYVESFLLDHLPNSLLKLVRQSSPGRVGALLDQLLQFVEEELQECGYVLHPKMTPEMKENLLARIQHIIKADIKPYEPVSVKRHSRSEQESTSYHSLEQFERSFDENESDKEELSLYGETLTQPPEMQVATFDSQEQLERTHGRKSSSPEQRKVGSTPPLVDTEAYRTSEVPNDSEQDTEEWQEGQVPRLQLKKSTASEARGPVTKEYGPHDEYVSKSPDA